MDETIYLSAVITAGSLPSAISAMTGQESVWEERRAACFPTIMICIRVRNE